MPMFFVLFRLSNGRGPLLHLVLFISFERFYNEKFQQNVYNYKFCIASKEISAYRNTEYDLFQILL